MTSFSRTFTLRPSRPWERALYRRRGVQLPLAHTRVPLGAYFPLAWRRFHRWYADFLGYFWLPCPLCGREFGGHELGGQVPDPTRDASWSRCICGYCTLARADVVARFAKG